MSKPQLNFKVLLIGDSQTGKSSLIQQYSEKKLDSTTRSTQGVEFESRVLDVMGNKIKFQFWDTAGRPEFRNVNRIYYRGSSAVVLVYDICRESSFKYIHECLAEHRDLVAPEALFVLVGNKIDMEAKRGVTFNAASQFARENGLLFWETSAKTGARVTNLFAMIADLLLQKTLTLQLEPAEIETRNEQQSDNHSNNTIAASRFPLPERKLQSPHASTHHHTKEMSENVANIKAYFTEVRNMLDRSETGVLSQLKEGTIQPIQVISALERIKDDLRHALAVLDPPQ